MGQMASLHGSVDDALRARAQLDVVGGVALAIGSLSVVVTSLFYVLSPPTAIAPVLDALPGAMDAAASGKGAMRIAGTSGVFGNLVMAMGCLLLTIARAHAGRATQAAGWAAIILSIVVFEIVDALTGFVLPQAATDTAGTAAFAAFRNLYAVFFLVGTAMFGLGAILALYGEKSSAAIDRYIGYVGIGNGVVSLIAVFTTFIDLPLAQLVGATVGLGAVIFVLVGARIAYGSANAARVA